VISEAGVTSGTPVPLLLAAVVDGQAARSAIRLTSSRPVALDRPGFASGDVRRQHHPKRRGKAGENARRAADMIGSLVAKAATRSRAEPADLYAAMCMARWSLTPGSAELSKLAPPGSCVHRRRLHGGQSAGSLYALMQILGPDPCRTCIRSRVCDHRRKVHRSPSYGVASNPMAQPISFRSACENITLACSLALASRLAASGQRPAGCNQSGVLG